MVSSTGENIIQRLVNKPKDCGNNMKNEQEEDEDFYIGKVPFKLRIRGGRSVVKGCEKDQETDSKKWQRSRII